MTLREQMATDLQSVLNTDDFAETFTYIPKSGPSRSVIGDVVREVVEEERRGYMVRVERADVTVTRNESSDLGGINRPLRGDKIVCSDGAEFTWNERITSIDSAAWVLHFERENMTKQGGV